MTKRSKSSRAKRPYAIGYGKPPVQHRFKPGRSGNPRGRPKVTPDISEIAATELKRRRKLLIAGKEVSVRTSEILIRRLVTDAAKGSIAAMREIYEIARPHLQKERRKQIEYKKITDDMSAQEAADVYAAAISQPIYDDD